MKILIKGYYGFGNLGDDILMLVSYKLLKIIYPDASYSIFSNNSINNSDANYPDSYNVYIKKLLDDDIDIIDWTYKGFFDLTFYGGGGVFFDNQKGSYYYHAINKILKYIGTGAVAKADNLLRKLIGKQHRLQSKRKVGAGIGIGPFHPSARQLFSKMAELGTLKHVIIRDKLSFATLSRLHFSGKALLGSDLAFLTEYWLEQHTLMEEGEPNNKIVIILKGKSQELYGHYKNLAIKLTELEYEVVFFSFDKYYDLDYIKYMSPEFTVCVWQPHQDNLMGFVKKIWQSRLCITDRAHGAIISALGNVVAMIIRSSQKSDQINAMLETDKILPVEPCLQYNVEEVLRVLENKAEITINLEEIVNENQMRIAGQLKSLQL